MKIGVFDSGIGGTTILSELKKILPNAEYKFIADSANCPYGEKEDAELYAIVKNNVEILKAWGAEIIVIACNTATTRCLKKLQADYVDTIFVGTEPAIKDACETGAKKILVLSTPGTANSERVHELIAENRQPDQIVDVVPCPGLASAIETNENIDAVLAENLNNVARDYEIVVLGCTHYPLIEEKIQAYFKNAKLIHSGEKVAQETAKLVQKLA